MGSLGRHGAAPGRRAARPVATALGVLGMPGFTAHYGLFELGRPQPGETVFVSGGAGAVGSTAGQLAKLQGCRVIEVRPARPRKWRGCVSSASTWRSTTTTRRCARPRRWDRRLLRQRRRGHLEAALTAIAFAAASSVALSGYNDEQPARGLGPVPDRDEAAPDGGLHHQRSLRPLSGVPSPRWPRGSATGPCGTGRRSSTASSRRRRPIGLLEGENVGKMLVRVGPEP